MGDSECDQRVLDIVRMFLAASNRGDHAVLVLESRKQKITTKYRSVERIAGAPASTSTISSKKNNPAGPGDPGSGWSSSSRRKRTRRSTTNRRLEARQLLEES
jgi:hypothetical protein